MTSPGLPPVDITASPLTPAGFGLYAAATITETGQNRRHLGGVNLWPYNCDEGYGTYDSNFCDLDGEPAVKAAAERPAPVEFEPLVVWAADECAPDQTEAEVQARAQHTLALQEPLLVESAFATKLLADAAAPVTVPNFATAIGVLEEFLGEQGYLGVIHAARRWAGTASMFRWNNQTGPSYQSPLAHRYAFGGGYADVLGNTIVATGPVYVWRDAVESHVVTTGSSPVPEHNNSVYAMAERTVVVGYECAILAVTIDSTEPEALGLFPGGFPGSYPTTGD